MLGQAVAGGITDIDVPDNKRLKFLQGLQGKYGYAFSKEMQPQQLSLESVRSNIQQQGLGQNPLEAQIAEQTRQTNEAIREKVVKLLESLDRKM